MPNKLTQEGFLAKAVAVHGVGRYDYSRVVYVRSAAKVSIICPQHGLFEQKPNGYLGGADYSACAGNATNLIAKFLLKPKQKHGDLYDYSNTHYTAAHIPAATRGRAQCAPRQTP
jgi:hypothetical protein